MKRLALSAALLSLALPATIGAQEGGKAAPAQAAAKPLSEKFLFMPEISAPIVDAGRLDGVLRIRIVLQARSDAAADRLNARMPDLNAAALSTAIEFARLYASPYTAVDVAKLTATLTSDLQRTDPSIGKVLIVKVTAKTV